MDPTEERKRRQVSVAVGLWIGGIGYKRFGSSRYRGVEVRE